ncbi:condensation domain-containing protein [Actinokineospora sp. 24-640]
MRALTPAQHELWTAGDPADPALWTGAYLDITGPLDAGALCRAIEATAREDETSRLRFTATPDGPRQWLDPTLDTSAELVTGLSPAAAVAAMRADLAADVDLARGPLSRHAVYRVAEDRHLWFTRVHHLVHDGESVLLTWARAARHYAEAVGERRAGRPFGSYSALLDDVARYPGSRAHRRDREHWARVMAGATRTRPPVAAIAATPPGEDWRAVVLASVTDAPDAVLSVPMPGGLARGTPAMLTSVLPLRVGGDVAGALRAMAWHQRYPTADLRRDLGWPTRWFGPYVTLLDARGPRFGATRVTSVLLSPGLVCDEPRVTAVRHDDGITIDVEENG